MTMFLKLFTIAAILAMAKGKGEVVGLVEDACSSTGTGDVRSI